MPRARKLPSLALAIPILASCAAGGTAADLTPAAPDEDSTPDARDAATSVEAAPAKDAGVTPTDPPDGDASADDPTLPHIDNFSASSTKRVRDLVRAALDGMGFDPARGDGPNPNDRVFVGKFYVAWIDQTGFYGKMNGLFPLNGQDGDVLDFNLKDPDGRPVNMFVPGEDGEGRWPTSYKGAEHIEFPSLVPEANDDPNCGKNGSICNWYSLNEAPLITNSRIPWWEACNPGSIPFSQRIDPISEKSISGGIKLVYEGPLVKQADGQRPHTGDACHEHELFPDGIRRPVYVQLGYELHGDKNYIDRTMQVRNGAGNPAFAGNYSLIGGFVMTQWPNPHYLKRYHRFWRPEQKAINMTWGGSNKTLSPSMWNDLRNEATLSTDVTIGWAAQPISVSATNAYAAGRSAQLAHVGPSDNDDLGLCLCSVHGGIELGGGLIHENISLPVAGGATTIEAKRRLTLPTDTPGGNIRGRAFTPNQLSHKIGRDDSGGWSASTGLDRPDHMAFGPYATDWGGGSAHGVLFLMVDNNVADDNEVVVLEVHDADTDQVVGSRRIHRREFHAPFKYQRFTVNGNLEGRAGHHMEMRVWWSGSSYVRLEKMLVHTSEY